MVNQNGKMVVLISPMDNQAQQLENSSETSPLNQRLRDNNSDISSSPSSAVTITTSEQSTKQLLHSGSSHQSIKLLLKIIIDVGILCIGESSSFSCINLKAIKISFCRKVWNKMLLNILEWSHIKKFSEKDRLAGFWKWMLIARFGKEWICWLTKRSELKLQCIWYRRGIIF